jgi:hypothetical protein
MDTLETMTPLHRSPAELEAGLDHVRQSPKTGGTLARIVIRPKTDERIILESVALSPESGVHGDRWAGTGRPNARVQVTLMNSRAIALFAGTPERWALAGDQLFVDLDLADDNLKPGQRLSIGTAILEVSETPHLGCAKFAARFGKAAFELVNSDPGKRLHLRGINASVIQAGTVTVGDRVEKC